jgi:glycosyltransferase involved in cell wall biosynthesis
MKISAYIHPIRTSISPTGVGKHIIHMVQGLTQTPGVDVRLFTSRHEISEGHIDLRSPLAPLPADGHPLSRSVMERIWLLTDHPRADRWIDGPEWVYCPDEAYVPTSRARTSATIHCVNWFEPELPWYGDDEVRKLRRRMLPKWKGILDRCDLVLVVSEFLKQRILALFAADASKIAVVGNGVEDEFFAAGKWADLLPSRDEPYIAIVGGLTKRKGADYVFPLASALARRIPRLQIRVAGKSEPEYFEKAKAYSNIVHCGYQGVDTLPLLMHKSIAAVFLSRYETFGIPAVEAMASGTPSIVSGFAALPEVVGDAGLVVDVNQPDAIADSIVRMHEDQQFRAGFVARGFARAEQFHWTAAVAKLLTAIERSPR